MGAVQDVKKLRERSKGEDLVLKMGIWLLHQSMGHGGKARFVRLYQHPDVLHRSNKEILNLHSPQSSPPGSLQSISRGVGKGSLR